MANSFILMEFILNSNEKYCNWESAKTTKNCSRAGCFRIFFALVCEHFKRIFAGQISKLYYLK
jgi:hypothetical protein